MSDTINETAANELPPVRVHFADTFPIETRCMTEEDEYAIVEILKIEYGIDDASDSNAQGLYDVTFFFTGIKSFSISDDDQVCLIRWEMRRKSTGEIVFSGTADSGRLEMGERFDEIESTALSVPEGDYTLSVLRD